MRLLMRQWWHKINDWGKTIWPTMMWSVFIFMLLITPQNKLPGQYLISIPYFDKWVHIFLFGIFTALWENYLSHKYINQKLPHRSLLILIIVAIYGILLEYLQIFVGRGFDLLDWLADVLGVFLFFSIKRLHKKSHKKNPKS